VEEELQQLDCELQVRIMESAASGYVSAEAESRVANRELCGALQKPYVEEEVLALVKQAICSQ